MGKAARLDSMIPSLIGVREEQISPGPLDMYFVRYDIDDLAAGSITSIALTRWVNYDSLPLTTRDPILEVRAHCDTGDFYIPASELMEIATEIGDVNLNAMLAELGVSA
jgi:hypothetical protein